MRNASLTALVALALQMGTLDVAMGRSSGFPWFAFAAMVAFSIAAMAAAIVLIVRTDTLIKRLHDANRQQP